MKNLRTYIIMFMIVIYLIVPTVDAHYTRRSCRNSRGYRIARSYWRARSYRGYWSYHGLRGYWGYQNYRGLNSYRGYRGPTPRERRMRQRAIIRELNAKLVN